jgi:guanyl-specific ribonuclease Sa
MSAVAGVPGLSALLAWPTEHLNDAADHWDSVAERSYGVAHQVWRDALSVDWQGETAEVLHTVTHADLQTTSGAVDQLQAASSVARSGASDLEAARSRVRYAVEDARAAGFEVGEDLSVVDRMSGGSAVQRAVRQAAAQAFAGDIGQRAAQLVGLDARVASGITAAVSGIGETFPSTPAPIAPPTNVVQAVDNHTFKQDPPEPLPVDPKDMTADEARAAWAEVNAEVKAWNARCGVGNVGPLPPAQYGACVASRGPLLERQAAIRARLGQLGIPVDGEGPASPGESGGGAGEGPVPQNVQDTLNQIDAGKWPGSANAPGTKGGSVFDNDQQLLPTRDASGEPITYQEWDVNPRVSGQDRDAQRIVTGSDGSAWYTTDHYQTFHRIR